MLPTQVYWKFMDFLEELVHFFMQDLTVSIIAKVIGIIRKNRCSPYSYGAIHKLRWQAKGRGLSKCQQYKLSSKFVNNWREQGGQMSTKFYQRSLWMGPLREEDVSLHSILKLQGLFIKIGGVYGVKNADAGLTNFSLM